MNETYVAGPVLSPPPIANTDIAATPMNTAVTLPTLANDAATAPGASLAPATLRVTAPPAHGTLRVDSGTGNITYRPATGFVGVDTYVYQVCDNQVPAQCTAAVQQETVLPPGQPNSTIAADYYGYTTTNVPVSGNVLSNDVDPQANALTVTPQVTTIPGKGLLVLIGSGAYTVTPEPGYVGPVNYPYQTCDNGTPRACAEATISWSVRGRRPSRP